ncbi:protein rep, partial [Pseudomonas sp. CAH-1]|uniref:protein rep n=1 Tax=Pseudomonas sp. CAH-1 TaxID=2605744 RepID=UPI0014125754
PPDLRAKLQENRAKRYELLASARSLFLYAGKQEGLKHPQDFHRTAKCKWVPVGEIGIHASREHSSAFYSGVMNCGSVWACPICAAKVQERRREEVAKAVAWAEAEGLQSVMVTLTFPHYAWHILGDLVKQQADALHRLRAGSPWARFKTATGYQGLIRSLELTFGEHGWHPHTHELWFVNAEVDAEAMKARILERWRNCCARAGLLDLENVDQVRAFNKHAVDVKGWCQASDYLAKQDDSRHWGVDSEIAKASTKQGRAKGKHPFRLLAMAVDGDKVAGAKFVEYAGVMKGRRQLFWSAGLKKRVLIEEKTDEEIVEDQVDKADLLGFLTRAEWKLVRSTGNRARLLDIAESNGGWAAVQHFLRSLRAKQPQAKALQKPQLWRWLRWRRLDLSLPLPFVPFGYGLSLFRFHHTKRLSLIGNLPDSRGQLPLHLGELVRQRL